MKTTNIIWMFVLLLQCIFGTNEEKSPVKDLKKITIRGDFYITKVRFDFQSEDDLWEKGANAGQPRSITIHEDEYIVKVEQENAGNEYEGNAFFFTTNKNRRWGMYAQTASKRMDQLITKAVSSGNQVIGLKIESGVLKGLIEDKAPMISKPSLFYALINEHAEKVEVKGFNTKKDAILFTQQLENKDKPILIVDLVSDSVIQKLNIKNEKIRRALMSTAISDGYLKWNTVSEQDINILQEFSNVLKTVGVKNSIFILISMSIVESISAWTEMINRDSPGYLIEMIYKQQPNQQRQGSNNNNLYRSVARMICIRTIQTLMQTFKSFTDDLTQRKIGGALQLKFIQHLFTQPAEFFNCYSKSDLKSLVDTDAFLRFIMHTIPQAVRTIVKLVYVLHRFLKFSWKLTLFSMIAFIPLHYLQSASSNYSYMNSIIAEKHNSVARQKTNEAIDAMETVINFGTMNYHIGEYWDHKQKWMYEISNRWKGALVGALGYDFSSEYLTNGILLYLWRFHQNIFWKSSPGEMLSLFNGFWDIKNELICFFYEITYIKSELVNLKKENRILGHTFYHEKWNTKTRN